MYKLTHYKKKKKKKERNMTVFPKTCEIKGCGFKVRSPLENIIEIKMTCYCGMVHVLSNDFNEIYNSRG